VIGRPRNAPPPECVPGPHCGESQEGNLMSGVGNRLARLDSSDGCRVEFHAPAISFVGQSHLIRVYGIYLNLHTERTQWMPYAFPLSRFVTS